MKDIFGNLPEKRFGKQVEEELIGVNPRAKLMKRLRDAEWQLRDASMNNRLGEKREIQDRINRIKKEIDNLA